MLSRTMKHLELARKQLENLWALGTDYNADVVRQARRENRMLHLDLDMTGECQLKCFYCDRTPDRFNDVPNRRELTTAERKDIIEQAREMGATTVEFPGAGEPMIDTGFWAIVEFISERGMIPVVFTSGYHLDTASIDRLYTLGATVFLKYNSSRSEVQDKMVGVKGYGDKATEALHKLVERGFNRSVPTRMAIDMVVTPQLQDSGEIDNLFRWCRKNNVHNYIMTLIPEGLADRENLILERRRSDELIRRLQRIDEEEFGLHYEPSRPMAGGYRCRQVNVGLFVNLFGEVYDCNGLGRFLGHTRADSLRNIWNSTFAQHIREPDQNGFCLLRERKWDGVSLSGMNRKLEQYRAFSRRHGPDAQVEAGLQNIYEPKASSPQADAGLGGHQFQIFGQNS